MLINVTITGDKETAIKIQMASSVILTLLYQRSVKLALMLEAYIKTSKLNGQVLNRVTGALARSINNKVEKVTNGVVARIFSAGDVPYAGIHEFGGVIKHPGGTPYFIKSNGQAIFMSLKNNFSQLMPKTAPHDIKMPERSYLRSSLRDYSVKISTDMKESMVRAAQEAMRK